MTDFQGWDLQYPLGFLLIFSQGALSLFNLY
jgi:hypothetical protein